MQHNLKVYDKINLNLRQIITHSKKDTFTATPDKLPGDRERHIYCHTRQASWWPRGQSGWKSYCGCFTNGSSGISRDMLLGIVLQSVNVQFYTTLIENMPVPVAARSKV